MVRRKIFLLTVLPLTLCACANSQKPTTQPLARTEGSVNSPIVISGTPKRDAHAFAESERQLSTTDFENVEKIGPKPLLLEKPKTPDGVTTAPAATAIDDSELPVKIVELSDSKLRIIWTLRSYGGIGVASTRDKETSRRNVAIMPPDLTPLVTAITQQIAPVGSVVPIPASNMLVITCEKSQQKAVVDLLSKLDVPARQVEITAKIFEVSNDFDFQQGANLIINRIGNANSAQNVFSSFNTQQFLNSTQTGTPFQGSVVSLMQNCKAAGLSVDVALQLLADAGMVKVVSSPRMTVAVGQTGYLLAGQELPIQSANIVNNALQTTTTYKPVGVQLYITPETVSNKRVKLHTISIVSSISGFTPLPTLTGTNNNNNDLFVNPIIDSREAETQVTVDDGSTLVISGLRMIRQATREEKVPGLGDIPILGWLFKNHREQQQMTDLYFFVTPSLL